jgi:hypothetical protein
MSTDRSAPRPHAPLGVVLSVLLVVALVSGLLVEPAGASGGISGTGDVQPTVVAGFTDVLESDFFAEGAAWLKAEGFTTGYADDLTRFAPEIGGSRGQIATFIWRIAGQPSATFPCGFGDVAVSPEPYFGQAACWLKSEGITTGYGAPDTFAPDVLVTRGQMAALLWRWAGPAPGRG